MSEELTTNCPSCHTEFYFLFDGDLDSVANNDVDVCCDECAYSFTISVIAETSYSLQIESMEKR